jgi:predicted glutamine amidotransferase
MCRMLALTGHAECIGDILLRFQMLSLYGNSPDDKGHRDGWGIGYFNTGITVFKKAECAATSKDYLEILERVRKVNPRILVAHVRKASPNTLITDKEAHPFQKNTFLFCHNGSITKPDGQPLGKELDSILFLERIQKESLTEAIQYFWRFKYTSLTCLLTDGNTIWAYRDFRERENYYTLYYLKTEDFVLFCSEPVTREDWVLLRNHELIAVFPDHTLERSILL